MHTKSESIIKLSEALCAAQGEMENAAKSSTNPHFKSRYADLAEVINTVRPVFAKHGLSVTQWPSFVDNVAHVETILHHKSGEWVSNTASAPVDKQNAQGIGSATTYLRRYSLAALACVAQEDDDGNAASEREAKRKPAKPVEQAPARQTPHPDADDMLDWGDLLSAQAPDGSMYEVGTYDKADSKTVFAALQNTMRMSQTAAELAHWSHENAAEIWKLNSAARHHLRERFDALDEKLPAIIAVNMTEIG